MKVSTRVECGILAMLDIALHADRDEIVNVNGISQRQGISVKYLEQILPALRQARLIRSVKGARGGYVLAKSPREISLREVIDALDVTVLGDVAFHDDEPDNIWKGVLQKALWDQMTHYLQTFAAGISLTDLLEEYQKANEEAMMYYI